MHKNFRTVYNKNKSLPHYDIEKYKVRPQEHVNYHKKYTGYKGVVWTPLDLPKLELDLDKIWKEILEGLNVNRALLLTLQKK